MSEEILISRRAGPEEWYRGFLENQRGKWWERVVKYELIFDVFGEPVFDTDRNSPLLEAEYQGMMAMRDLALLGQKWVVWISPKGGISEYTGSRFCVGKVMEVRAGVKIDGLGICGDQDGEECLEVAKRLVEAGGTMLGEINNFDGLRDHPIGLEMTDEQVWESLSREIRIDQVWEAIRDGRVVKNNEKMEKRIEIVAAEMPLVRSDRELQKYLEMEMARRFGVRLMAGGNHGGSVIGTEKMGAFNYVFKMGEVRAEVVNRNGQRYCSVCGERLAEGATMCPKCGLKLNLI